MTTVLEKSEYLKFARKHPQIKKKLGPASEAAAEPGAAPGPQLLVECEPALDSAQ